MNRPLRQQDPPEIPLALRDTDVPRLVGWLRERFYPYLKRSTFDIIEQLNSQVQGVGPLVTADGTANQTIKVAQVGVPLGGSGSIQTIEPPMHQVGVAADEVTARQQSAFTGPIFVMPAALSTWTLVTGGNIAKASTAVPGQLMVLFYDGSLFWPTY